MPPLIAAFEKYYDEITAHVVQKTGDRTIAADIVQDVYAKIATFKTPHLIENPRAFLYKVAGNMVIDYVRKDKTRAQYIEYRELDQNHPASLPSAETQLIDRQRLSMLQDAIETLPPKCKQAFVMRKFENRSAVEIAQELGISRGMVEKHVRNGLLHCLRHMDQKEGEA